MDTPAATTKISYKLVNNESFESEINIYKYTERCIAITTSDHFGKSFKTPLSELGSFNTKLRIGKGWVFPNTRYPALQTLFEKISKDEVKGDVPMEYNKKDYASASGPLGQFPSEPNVVTSMKQLFSKLSLTVESEKNIFIENDNKYIWGTTEKVNSLIKEMNVSPYMVFETLTHKMVIAK
jgi:hypothetical protein